MIFLQEHRSVPSACPNRKSSNNHLIFSSLKYLNFLRVGPKGILQCSKHRDENAPCHSSGYHETITVKPKPSAPLKTCYPPEGIWPPSLSPTALSATQTSELSLGQQLPSGLPLLLPGLGGHEQEQRPLAPALGAMSQWRVEKESQNVNLVGSLFLFPHKVACTGFAAGSKSSVSKITTGNRGFQLPAWILLPHLLSGWLEPRHQHRVELLKAPWLSRDLRWETIASSFPQLGGLCTQ